MHKTVNNLISIQNQLKELAIGKNKTPTIIAVSKTFDMNSIEPLIDHGQKFSADDHNFPLFGRKDSLSILLSLVKAKDRLVGN